VKELEQQNNTYIEHKTWSPTVHCYSWSCLAYTTYCRYI